MKDTPFGQNTRMRVLYEYFAKAGDVTEANAWEHVYRCLLWMNLGAGLVHIYDSNHMQPGGVFHDRAVRFTKLLCDHWDIPQKGSAGPDRLSLQRLCCGMGAAAEECSRKGD